MGASIRGTVLALLIAVVYGQNNSYGCLSQASMTSLTACDRLSTTIDSCFAQTTNTASVEGCYCKQAVVDDIVDCGSEYRLCYLNDQYDYYYTSVLDDWNERCDDYVTYTPTTPVLSNPTTTVPTYQPAACTDYSSSCSILTNFESDCLSLDPSATASSFYSCACAPSLLSMASVCFYDVAVTCRNQSTALSDIDIFGACGTIYSQGQLITAMGASVNTSATSTVSSPTAASPAPKTTTGTSASNTAGSEGSSASATGTASQTTASATSSSVAASYECHSWLAMVPFALSLMVYLS
ncbi:hypothetical protein EDD36DRAFT_189067 [Exophiala viscosa]|uniref:Extracellular membrane protein CFEM domain-containing protein n=1 Tax=Exophiala viscosa TaxID=2486360 RepID=A0AAN6DZD2_9EURO|nr:hypothetical protein EDD36DRAFT_189067 [Exophiala viscosa]